MQFKCLFSFHFLYEDYMSLLLTMCSFFIIEDISDLRLNPYKLSFKLHIDILK